MKLDIDDSGIDAVVALMAMRGELLRVTVEIEHGLTNGKNRLQKQQRETLLTWLAADYDWRRFSAWCDTAGIPQPSRAGASYYRTKYRLRIDELHKARRDGAINSGLALKEERVKRLSEHADALEKIKWVSDDKGRLWNEAAWRETLADIAAEMGQRTKSVDVTSGGKPLLPFARSSSSGPRRRRMNENTLAHRRRRGQTPLPSAQQEAWDSKRALHLHDRRQPGGQTSFSPWWLAREIQTCGSGDYLAVTATFDLYKLKFLPKIRQVFEHLLGIGRYWAGDQVMELQDPASGLFLATRADDPMWARIILRRLRARVAWSRHRQRRPSWTNAAWMISALTHGKPCSAGVHCTRAESSAAQHPTTWAI